MQFHMVWTWPFEQLLEVVWGTLSWLSTPLVVNSGHERALAPLLVLLRVGAVGGAFAGILVLLCLALGAVENCPDRLLAQGMAGGDFKEFLGRLRAITS